jgi:uncharacterized protein (TIGR03000 family)
MPLRAVIAGATGLIGSNLAEHLLSKGWEVYGVARTPQGCIPGVRPVAADMLDPTALRAALAGIDPTHVFFTTWVRRASEEENIAANGALVRNLLAALGRSASLRHVALVTSLKHYLGPFGYYAKVKPDTPLREEMPRLPLPNLFYAQEDELFAAARRRGFTWSVHRSHTTVGYSLGTSMNVGVTLAVYATICRETGRPFVFPGSAQQPVRAFQSAPLTPGQQYTYEFRARWKNDDGREVTQTQQVIVTAGAHVRVDFPVPPGAARPALSTNEH